MYVKLTLYETVLKIGLIVGSYEEGNVQSTSIQTGNM
jgi:hypothetical protein